MYLLIEDGSKLLLEHTTGWIELEDSLTNYLLLENGNRLVTELLDPLVLTATSSQLLLENGFSLLLENGSRLIGEN